METMAAALAFVAMVMLMLGSACVLLAYGFKQQVAASQKQIASLLQHQRQLILMVKAKDSFEAEASLTRLAATEAPLSVPAAAAEVIKSVSDAVPIKDEHGRLHPIRFIGLDPQAEADARDEAINGDDA